MKMNTNKIKSVNSYKLSTIFIFALVMFMGLSLLQAVPVEAVEELKTWYVDASVSESGDGKSVETAFKTIGEGVTAASAGDTIIVAAGTYSEQVIINKSLTLKGSGNPEIQAPGNPDSFKFAESTASWEPVVFAFGGTNGGNSITGTDTINVTISGFTVNGNDRVPTGRSVGILLRNVKGTVSDNTVKNMCVDGKETFGIVAYGNSDVTISGNDVSGYARCGIGVNGDGGVLDDPRAIIMGNTVTGPGMDEHVTWAPNGIQIGWGATGEISRNYVSGNGWPGEKWTGSGILVYASNNIKVANNTIKQNQTGIIVGGENGGANGNQVYGNTVDNNTYGISIQDKSVNTTIKDNTVKNNTCDGIDICSFYGNPPTGTVIQDNIITGNNTGDNVDGAGIWIGESVDGTKVTINHNEITGNNRFGILNTNTTCNIDATCNWWGAASGPYHATTNPEGTGNAVSDNVLYYPWYTNASRTTLSNFITLTKTGPVKAKQGDVITYTIKYKNNGNFRETNVVITETYPPEVEFVRSDPLPTTGNNQWKIGDLAPGDEGTITVTVRIK